MKLQQGCTLTGTILDEVAAKPAIDAVATIQRLDTWGEFFAASDAAGHFRIVVPEGRYNILVAAENRVCVALTDRECQAGQTVELPRITLIDGGFISGRVINSKTGESETVGEDRAPIAIGLIGPSQPLGRAISPTRLAMVDGTGHFTLRVAPGENFPYFVNIRGDRMAWDTQQQPAIVVKEGETTNYDMLITPSVSPAEKLKAAQKLVDELPKQSSERTERILVEFRKLSHTVDECELWCTLMQELVAIGPDAVPQLCEELDHTTADRSIRRLAFALRAIGDPRAVPALVRAIPRTLCPSSSDYGLIVNDFGLTEFMQKNDMSAGSKKRLGGNYFDLGRPPRELFATLEKLTNQKFDDDDIFGISLSDDPRRQVLQRRLYLRTALRWQTWWEANWRGLTNDGAYQTVGLKHDNEALPAATKSLGPDRAARRWRARRNTFARRANRQFHHVLFRFGYRLRPQMAGPISQGRGQDRFKAIGRLGGGKRRRPDVQDARRRRRHANVRAQGAGYAGLGNQRARSSQPRSIDRRRHTAARPTRSTNC